MLSKPTSKNIELHGTLFEFVKIQRDKKSAVYKGSGCYLRIGAPEKIRTDLALHRQLESAGFPVAKIISEGELNGEVYFIESTLGERSLGEIFADDTQVHGHIRQESFDKFLNIVKQFAQSQLRTRISDRRSSEFIAGIHLDILCQELPDYESKIRARFEVAQNNLATFPFVVTHGDFNPNNLYPEGIIDLEDSFYAPFGYDLVGALVHIDYFPDSQDFEFFARYRFSDDQKKQYFLLLDDICSQEHLPALSEVTNEFAFSRAAWLAVQMYQYPKTQQFRYRKFIEDFLQ